MLGIVPAWRGMQVAAEADRPAGGARHAAHRQDRSTRGARRRSAWSTRRCRCASWRTPRAWSRCEAQPQPRTLPFTQRADARAAACASWSSQARKQVAKRARREHYPAPYAILELWQQVRRRPVRRAADDPALDRDAVRASHRREPDPHVLPAGAAEGARQGGATSRRAHVHVVGAGVMGGDIAAMCAMRGLTVTLQDTAPERLAPAIKRAREAVREAPARAAPRRATRIDRLIPDVAGDGVGAGRRDHRGDLREPRGQARAVRRSSRAMAKPGAILATQHLEPQARGHRRRAARIRRAWSASTSSIRCRR